MITAIMPTKNRRECVPLAIHCFRQQSYLDIELVILDDGADDVSDLIPDDPRIRYRRIPATVLGEKRNMCCALAQGEVIVHWDDDDWSAPGRIADQVARLQTSPCSVSGYHQLYWWDERTSTAHQYSFRGNHPYAIGTSLCYWKDWWASHPFEKKNTGEDNDFVNLAVNYRSIISAPGGQMMVCRQHAKSTSQRSIGGSSFPQVPIGDLPPEFFVDLAASKLRRAA